MLDTPALEECPPSRPSCTRYLDARRVAKSRCVTTFGETDHWLPQIELDEEVITMQDRLLRRRQVEEITGMSRSTIYKMMQSGEFPRPVRIGPSAVRWRASDIVAWVESRPVARGEFDKPGAVSL